MRRRVVLAVASLAIATTATTASAQGGGKAPSQGPTQSAPTRARNVGPQRGGGPSDDEPQGPSPSARPTAEPTAQAPADPLAMPEGIADRIGTDHDGAPPPAEGSDRSSFPLFIDKGDMRVRLIPPLYLEHTRGLDPSTGRDTEKTDRQRLAGVLFYQRRSKDFDADVLFPLAWRVRDRQNRAYVLGPLVHREAPYEHDNWLAPLVFEGARKDGGYFHVPLLLTSSHWNEKKAFTLVGPYFRDRSESDVDWGVAPFVFRGNNGNLDGARKTYTLIPPALFFHRERELTEEKLTVIGPVVTHESPKRSTFNLLPIVYSIKGRPEASGVKESHFTLFPLFHYGESPTQKLFVLPGYLRRITPTADTMLTPFYSHATTRNKSTSLDIAGPILPIYYRKTDVDVGYKGLGIFPFYFGSHSPKGSTFATPLFARFESYNVSRTYWAFPNIVYTRDTTGWETDIHPIVYVGRSNQSSHTVLAPIFWDFTSPKARTTIGFPVYWRFADTTVGSVTQVTANTLYREKKVVGGTDWQFHLLPLFSYGQHPKGYWWNVLFGLAGFDKDADATRIKALWLPIKVGAGTERNVADAK